MSMSMPLSLYRKHSKCCMQTSKIEKRGKTCRGWGCLVEMEIIIVENTIIVLVCLAYPLLSFFTPHRIAATIPSQQLGLLLLLQRIQYQENWKKKEEELVGRQKWKWIEERKYNEHTTCTEKNYIVEKRGVVCVLYGYDTEFW